MRTFTLALVLVSCFSTLNACSSIESSGNTDAISPDDKNLEPPEGDEAAKDESDSEPGEADIAEDDLLERAKSAYDRGLYSVARENWTKLRENYPSSYYATLAELKISDTFFYAGDYATAASSYEEFIKLHPAHDATPYARYQLGNSFRQQYAGVAHDQAPLEAALKNYKRTIDDYPNSEYALAARRGVQQCRELLAEHEATIARFYKKQGYEPAFVKRLQVLSSNYPGSKAAAWANAELMEIRPDLARSKQKSSLVAPPGVPELLAAAGAQSAKESRGRLSQPYDSKREVESVKSQQVDSAINVRPSPVIDVDCSQEANGLLVFSLALKQPMKLLGVRDWSAVLVPSGDNSTAATSRAISRGESLNSCQAGSVKLEIFRTKEDPDEMLLEFSGLKSKKREFFALDRPSRFVAVIEK